MFFRFSISLLCGMSYMTLSSRERSLFQKIIPLWHLFLLCSYFRTHPNNTTFQNIGGTDAWAVPHLNLFFWGPSPSVPLGFRPCPHLVKSQPMDKKLQA